MTTLVASLSAFLCQPDPAGYGTEIERPHKGFPFQVLHFVIKFFVHQFPRVEIL